MILYYVRHGDPIYNPDGLTPLGKRQAEACARLLCRTGLDEIYSSTSQRAIDTATPTAEILKKEIKLLDFAHEADVRRLRKHIFDGQILGFVVVVVLV